MRPSPKEIQSHSVGESTMFTIQSIKHESFGCRFVCYCSNMRIYLMLLMRWFRFSSSLPIQSLVIVEFIFIFIWFSWYKQYMAASDKHHVRYLQTFRLHVQMLKCQTVQRTHYQFPANEWFSFFFRATKCRAKQLMCFASKASNKQFANSTQTTFTKWIEILSHIYIVINLHRTNAIIKYLLTLPAAGQFAGQTENPCGHYMMAFLHRLRFHFVKQALIRIMFCILFHNFSLLVCNLFNLITTLMVR